jgi:hypothetical protein
MNATRRSRNAGGSRGWRSGDELAKPAQVLGDGCEREFELGSPRPAQSQTPERQYQSVTAAASTGVSGKKGFQPSSTAVPTALGGDFCNKICHFPD